MNLPDDNELLIKKTLSITSTHSRNVFKDQIEKDLNKFKKQSTLDKAIERNEVKRLAAQKSRQK